MKKEERTLRENKKKWRQVRFYMKDLTSMVVVKGEEKERKKKRPILMAVTRKPQDLRMSPMLLAVTPLPSPLTTPPETTTYFIFFLLFP